MAADAFPGGVYAKYKRATQFFLDWLLHAHAHTSSPSSSSSTVSLDAFHAVVDVIARAPAASLSPTLLHQLPRALAACQTAITLRERVTQYFAGAGRADDAHAHFLRRLKTWRGLLLQCVELPAATDSTTTGATDKTESKKKTKKKKNAARQQKIESPTMGDVSFTNYYDVLRLPDDYFAEHDDTALADQLAAVSLTSASDRDRLFDEAFEQDLQMELACLLLELQEMTDHVYEIYCEVKRETRTLMEATAVVFAAVQFVQSRVAALQLRYPSIREAQDVVTLLDKSVTQDLHTKLVRGLHAMDERKAIDHIPGLFLADFMWVASALMTFTSAIPRDANQAIVLRDGYFGETYDEERTPHYMLPDISSVSPFFMQQLPLLYNSLMASRLAHGGKSPTWTPLDSSFWQLIDEYFRTQKVGIPVVFTCICWVKSVTALQGNGGLRRHLSLAITHTWEIENRLRLSVAKGYVSKASRKLQDSMEDVLKTHETNRKELAKGRARGLLRANPILAGCSMLHDHLPYLQFGSEALLVTSRLRAFLHLYVALVDRKLLDTVPFVDELLEIYGDVMFTPSRSAAVQGAYCRTYMLSSHLTAAAVDAIYRGAPPLPKHTAVKARDCYHLRDLSLIFRLVSEKDLSGFAPSPHESLSAQDLLGRVADQCADEVRTSRVLSRDMLKLNDDITDLFETLCDGLGRRWYHDEFLASKQPGMSRQHMVNRALEDAVMMPLLPCLDCLDVDDRDETSNVLRMTIVQTSRVAENAMGPYCQRAADIIRRRFGATSAATIEATYFVLPRYTNTVTREFGDQDFKRDPRNPLRAQ